PEKVAVEAAAETAISRHQYQTDALDLALDQEGMVIFTAGARDVRDDVADFLGVGPRRSHAILRLAHLARRDHFHGLGDLLRVLDARDLGADFFGSGHRRGTPTRCGWL